MIKAFANFLIICVAVFVSGFLDSAFADVEPTPVAPLQGGCVEYVMCAAQTATGDCTALPASGDERVANVETKGKITFYSTQSNASAYICDIISNDVGHDVASGDGHKINNASLTETARVLTFNGLFKFIWVTCPTIADNQVTITAQVCTANR